MTSTWIWHTPHAFFLLISVPILAALDWWRVSKPRSTVSYSSLTSFAGYPKTWRIRWQLLPVALRAIALSLAILALARPQIATPVSETKSEGIDILLTIDTSLSMKALDMDWQGEETSRVGVAKSVVVDFIQKRRGDRIGLVVFGSEAYTQCPLTTDQDALLGYLDMIDSGMAGDGTAIGNAIALSVKRLGQSKAKSRIIVLLTDGKSNAGQISPEASADLAKKAGIKIYSVSIGSDQKLVPFPVESRFGTYKQYRPQFETDDETLKKLAEATSGKFFKAQTGDSLEQVYKTIDRLEKSEFTVKTSFDYEELFPKFLLPALLLLAATVWLSRTTFLRIPA